MLSFVLVLQHHRLRCWSIALGLVLAGVLAIPRFAAAAPIKELVVAENNKTTDATVLFIADLSKGDDFDENVRAEAIVSLKSSGLFKSVDIFSEPHPKGGTKVTIVAMDKHSWVIAPTFYNQPTNRGGGLGFGENNLFGTNKKLLLYGQVATGDSFLIAAYIDPSIKGTRFNWALDTFLQNQRVIEYGIPQNILDAPSRVRQTKQRYLNVGASVGVTLFRTLTLESRLRGAYVFYGKTRLLADDPAAVGLTSEEVDDPNDIADPGGKGWDITTKFSLKYNGRANWNGVTVGNSFGLSYERALVGLGSDFDYQYARVGWTNARRYFKEHNLVLKSSVGYGQNLPFHQELTSGGTSLRGYEGSQFRGDLNVAFNAEYSVPLFSIPFPLLERLAVRGLAFYDSRYTTFVSADADKSQRNYLPGIDSQTSFAPFKNAVGVGTRFFARSIVLPLLGLDVGYGLESGAIEVYFAIGLTDI